MMYQISIEQNLLLGLELVSPMKQNWNWIGYIFEEMNK